MEDIYYLYFFLFDFQIKSVFILFTTTLVEKINRRIKQKFLVFLRPSINRGRRRAKISVESIYTNQKTKIQYGGRCNF